MSTSGVGGGEKRVSRRERQREAHRRRSSWSSGRLALIVAVVGLVLIVLFIIPRGQQKPAEDPLPRSGFVTGTPINNVDPTSGKPIVAGIASTYKGYTIGHCCTVSKGDWEALTTSQKEKAIRRFLN